MTNIIDIYSDFLAGGLGTSITGGIIAGMVVALLLAIWNTRFKPFIEGKTSSLNLTEKTKLDVIMRDLVFGITWCVVGCMLTIPFIYGYTYIENPVFGEFLKYQTEAVILLILGLGTIWIGGVWAIPSLRELQALSSSVSSRKGRQSYSIF